MVEAWRAFQATTGVRVPYRLADRQPGDVSTLIADPGRIEKEWGWRAGRTLEQMLADSWRFQSLHPDGYQAAAGPHCRPSERR